MRAHVRRGIAFICRPLSKKNICWLSLLVIGYVFLSTLGSIFSFSFNKQRLATPYDDNFKQNNNPTQDDAFELHNMKEIIHGAAQKITEKCLNCNQGTRQFVIDPDDGQDFEDQNVSFFENPDEDIEINFPFEDDGFENNVNDNNTNDDKVFSLKRDSFANKTKHNDTHFNTVYIKVFPEEIINSSEWCTIKNCIRNNKFNLFFKRLHSFELHENSLICNCWKTT